MAHDANPRQVEPPLESAGQCTGLEPFELINREYYVASAPVDDLAFECDGFLRAARLSPRCLGKAGHTRIGEPHGIGDCRKVEPYHDIAVAGEFLGEHAVPQGVESQPMQ